MPEFVRRVIMTENNDGTITIEGHLFEGEEPVMALLPLRFEDLLDSLSEEPKAELHGHVTDQMIIIEDPDKEFN